MPTVDECPEVYEHSFEIKLRNEMLLNPGVTCNNRYSGDPLGGIVNIVNRAEATVATYDPATGMSSTVTPPTYTPITISKDWAIFERIDKYTMDTVTVPIVQDTMDNAAYGLANSAQVAGVKQLEDNATGLGDSDAGASYGTGVELTASAANTYTAILAAKQAMSEAKVPNDNGRILFVSPKVANLLLQDTTHFVLASNAGQAILQTGELGRVAGFRVFECNFFNYQDSSTATTGETEFIAYHINWFTEIAKWSVDPVVYDMTKTSDTYIGAVGVKARLILQYALTNTSAAFKKYYIAS